MKTIIKHWLLVAIIITGFSGLLEATVQQVIRQFADDPQIQMAEDAAAALTNGQQVQNVVPAEKVDIAKSLATYIIVFDANGKVIASSAQLNGQSPTPPAGVFDYVKQNGEDRITWQPLAYYPCRLGRHTARFSAGNGSYLQVIAASLTLA